MEVEVDTRIRDIKDFEPSKEEAGGINNKNILNKLQGDNGEVIEEIGNDNYHNDDNFHQPTETEQYRKIKI